MRKTILSSAFIFALLWMVGCQGEDPEVQVNTADDFTVLTFSEEFNTDGAPKPSIWSYDLGTGNNGWGNNEEQNYTNNSKNVKVEGGNLVITAIRESSGSKSFHRQELRLRVSIVLNMVK